jgi:hypothetical protein
MKWALIVIFLMAGEAFSQTQDSMPDFQCRAFVQKNSAAIQLQIHQLNSELESSKPQLFKIGEANLVSSASQAAQDSELILKAVKKIDKNMKLTDQTEISAIQGLCSNNLNVEATVW